MSFLFLIVFIASLGTFLLFRQIRSIFFVHQMSWCSAFALALLDERVDFSEYFIFLMTCSVLVYQVFWLFVFTRNNSEKNNSISKMTWSAAFHKGKSVLFYVSLIIFCVLTIRLLLTIFSIGFSNKARAFELAFGSSELINGLLFLMIPLAYFMAVGIFLNIKSKLNMLGILLTFVFLYFLGVKGNVYFLALIVCFAFYYTSRVSLIMMPILGVMGALLFIAMMAARYGLDLNYDNIGQLGRVLTGYVAFNFANLQSYTEGKTSFGLGVGLLLSIPCLLVAGTHWCADEILGVDRSKPYHLYVSPNFNIETGYGKLYVEFGDAVFLILPLLLFLLHLSIYKRRFRSIGFYGIYCIISAASCLLFFDLRILHSVTLFSLVIVVAFSGIFLRRRMTY